MSSKRDFASFQEDNANMDDNNNGLSDREIKRKLKKQKKREMKAIARGEGSKDMLQKIYGESAIAQLEVMQDILNKRSKQSVRFMDIQNLLIWITGNIGLLPDWVFVKNKPLIETCVILQIDGLTQHIYEQYSRFLPILKRIGEATTTIGDKKEENMNISGIFKLNLPLSLHSSNKIMHSLLEWQGGSSSKKQKLKDKRKKQSYKPLKERTKISPSKYILTIDELVEHRFPTKEAFQKQQKQQSSSIISNSNSSSICKCKELSSFPCVCNLESEEDKKVKLFGLDCEMCTTTTEQYSLARVSLHSSCGLVYDQLVKPESPIVDYLTKYSGLTEEILAPISTTIKDVQEELKKIVSRHDIIVGHSLENDMWALQMFHDQIIDTSVLFPHSRGTPMKNSLKYITKKFLNRTIQQQSDDVVGHDSLEDAKAALDLALLKIENGPEFGLPDNKGITESLFESVSYSVTMFDDATHINMFGAGKVNGIPCLNNNDVALKMTNYAKKNKTQQLLYGRLSILNSLRNLTYEEYMGSNNIMVETSIVQLNKQIEMIYDSVPKNSMILLCSGDNDTKSIKELRSKTVCAKEPSFFNEENFMLWSQKYQEGICVLGCKHT